MQKVKANFLHARVLKDCANLMYRCGILQGHAIVQAAKDKFKDVKAKYLVVKTFLNYFEKT